MRYMLLIAVDDADGRQLPADEEADPHHDPESRDLEAEDLPAGQH